MDYTFVSSLMDVALTLSVQLLSHSPPANKSDLFHSFYIHFVHGMVTTKKYTSVLLENTIFSEVFKLKL